jgi:hypothetical protein
MPYWLHESGGRRLYSHRELRMAEPGAQSRTKATQSMDMSLHCCQYSVVEVDHHMAL